MSYKYRWDEYDQVIVGVSGGKDSTALMLWMEHYSGCPKDKIRYEFWDTGNEDPLLYAYLDMLSNHVASIVTRYPPLDFWELARKKKRFPSRKARFCTGDLKIVPSEYDILFKSSLGANILKMTGKRREEGTVSNDRGDTLYLEHQPISQKINNEVVSTIYGVGNPICEFTIDDVWNIHKEFLLISAVIQLVEDDWTMKPEMKAKLVDRMRRHGIPRNPLYDIGARRVGCFPCIYSAKNEIRGIVQYRPETIDNISHQEQSVNPQRGISTFFGKGYIPQRFCSKKVIAKDGTIHMVPTIHDVATWSMTGKMARQPMLDFDAGDLNVCSIGGYCE